AARGQHAGRRRERASPAARPGVSPAPPARPRRGRAHRRISPSRRARGVGGIGAGVDLVAVEEAVLVAVDAEALARAGRDAGVGPLLAGDLRLLDDRALADQRLGDAIGAELPVRETEPAARLAVQVALHDEVAVAGGGARDEQVDALGGRRAAGRSTRHLLAD